MKRIYDLVAQKINILDGLLFREKYCGKSKLKSKINEQNYYKNYYGFRSNNPIDNSQSFN